MTQRLTTACAAIAATVCFSHAAGAATLYNPAAGTTPAAQGWYTSSSGGTASASVSGASYDLDTTADPAISAGSALLGQVPFDTANGFNLTFGLQVLAESHLTTDRAGFSLIMVGANPADSIEIAFWTNQVFVYAFDSTTDTFSHGASAIFDTSTTSHVYSLTVQNQQYSLSSGGTSLLSGALVNYSAQGGIYALGDSIFVGDDTSRAASSVALGAIVLNPVPEPATAGLFLLGGALLAVRKRRLTK